MFHEILKSKIHNATVTGTNTDYVGSIRIDGQLIEAAGLIEHEKVLVSNVNNGERFETYVIVGKRGSGIVELNGAAAKLARKGHKVIIMSFALMDDEEVLKHKPRIVMVDRGNRIL